MENINALLENAVKSFLAEKIEFVTHKLRLSIDKFYTQEFGKDWYLKKDLFKFKHVVIGDRNTTQYDILYNKIILRCFKGRKIERYPLSSEALAILDLSDLSKLYSLLKKSKAKLKIAESFRLKTDLILSNWLHALTIVNNKSIYNGLALDKPLPLTIIVPRKWHSFHNIFKDYESKANSLAAVINVLSHLTDVNLNLDFLCLLKDFNYISVLPSIGYISFCIHIINKNDDRVKIVGHEDWRNFKAEWRTFDKISGYIYEVNNKFGYFSSDLKHFVDCKYDNITLSMDSFRVHGNLYSHLVLKNANKMGLLILQKELIIIDTKYDSITYKYDWSHPYFIIGMNGKKGIIDSKGKTIIPIEYDKIEKSSFFFMTTNDGKHGVVKGDFINENFKVILECIYDEILVEDYCTQYGLYHYFKIRIGDLWGISVDGIAGEYIPCKWENIFLTRDYDKFGRCSSSPYFELIKGRRKVKIDFPLDDDDDGKEESDEEENEDYPSYEDDYDYERDTFYALGGDDYDSWRNSGGNLDDMMDGMGF